MRRHAASGLVLLDALIAFALATFAVSAIFLLLPSSTNRSAERMNRLLATEFAYSVLEEYRATFPLMPLEGATPEGWSWRITERPLPDTPEDGNRDLIALVEVTAETWHADRPSTIASLVSVIARRSE